MSFGASSASADGPRGKTLSRAGSILAIARNTATEAVRQPVFGIILLIAITLIILSPFLTMFTLMEGTKMTKDMGLATMFLAGVLLAAFGASNVVAEEIENHTALTVMSKPVGRFEFVLGKYLGVLGAVTAAFYLMSLCLALIVALGGFEAGAMQTTNYWVLAGVLAAMLFATGSGIFANYFHDRSFTSVALKAAIPAFTVVFLVFCLIHPEELKPTPFGAGIDFNVVNCAVLIYLAMWILTAIALAASTRANVVVNVSFCTIVFFLGLMSDFLFGPGAREKLGPAGRWGAQLAYWLTPNLQMCWMADILAQDGTVVPVVYVAHVAGYAACYALAVLTIAMILFEERQLS